MPVKKIISPFFVIGLMYGAGMAAQANVPSVPSPQQVIKTYANIAHAGYTDSLVMAQALHAAIEALVAQPGQQTLAAARAAWIAAREPYMQTEVYRFGNAIVDDWEGRVNAWPLDEGLIDYVDASYGTSSEENALYTANVIAGTELSINGKAVDVSSLSPVLLAETLHEAEGNEANVATGYHAIEFLLWGQDLNGTNAGKGNRPATDFSLDECTNKNCARRIEYLRMVAALLVTDLEEMVNNWSEGGAARMALMKDEQAGLTSIITGIGSLSYGELAGERMKLGLLLHDPEEEHDCFSDNTHNSHYFDQLGIRNVYVGHYKRIDGTVVSGASISDLVKAADKAIDMKVRTRLNETIAMMAQMRARAETIEAYDQMIGDGNMDGNAAVQAPISALIAQADAVQAAATTLGLGTIEFEGSDSLDAPEAIFQ